MSKFLKFILILAATSGFTQAPKKANTITIITTDPIEKAFAKYEQYLQEAGYIVRSKEDPIRLQTSAKENYYDLPGSSTSVYVELTLNLEQSDGNTKIKVTGTYADQGGMAKTKSINNRGNPRFGVGLAWRLMNDMAIKYPSGQITYSIE